MENSREICRFFKPPEDGVELKYKLNGVVDEYTHLGHDGLDHDGMDIPVAGECHATVDFKRNYVVGAIQFVTRERAQHFCIDYIKGFSPRRDSKSPSEALGLRSYGWCPFYKIRMDYERAERERLFLKRCKTFITNPNVISVRFKGGKIIVEEVSETKLMPPPDIEGILDEAITEDYGIRYRIKVRKYQVTPIYSSDGFYIIGLDGSRQAVLCGIATSCSLPTAKTITSPSHKRKTKKAVPPMDCREYANF